LHEKYYSAMLARNLSSPYPFLVDGRVLNVRISAEVNGTAVGTMLR